MSLWQDHRDNPCIYCTNLHNYRGIQRNYYYYWSLPPIASEPWLPDLKIPSAKTQILASSLSSQPSSSELFERITAAAAAAACKMCTY